jgi:hypothetical protein
MQIYFVIMSGRVRWVEYVSPLGEVRNTYKMLVGKAERRRPFRRYGPRW